MKIGDKTPDEVAEVLRSEQTNEIEDKIMASSNQKANLGYSGGYFVLSWSATDIGKYDWVGLYKSITDPDSSNIRGAWQWASKAKKLKTSQGMYSGYQCRYLVWNSGSSKYVSVARTDPFPPISICSA